MSHPVRSAAACGCALAAALALGAAATASAATVTPHVFEGGITLLDLAGENLEPWGFYDGTKGMPAPAIASGRETATTPGAVADPVPGGWIAAAGWSVPAGEGAPPGTAPFVAPVPLPAGFPGPRPSSACFWGNDRFGSVESRDRCGHPVPAAAVASRQPAAAPLPQPIVLLPGPSIASPIGPVTPVPVPVPLPAAGWLLGAALAACLCRKRR